MATRLILMGPPGSGKGTQAKLLSERFALAHIGTGQILREAVELGTAAGKLADPYVKSGQLVPDDVVNELVADLFRRPGRPERFIMDGYPRTRAQAVAFDRVLREQSLNVDSVILLLVDDEEIVRRLSGRWSCPRNSCMATYHVSKKPPKRPGFCDLCGSALVQREDDREETIRQRLKVYRRNIKQLIPYYRERNLLREVDGQGDIKVIQAHIVLAINPPASVP